MRIRDISYTTSPLSEFLGSRIYEILGYDVHKMILGFRNNKLAPIYDNGAAFSNKISDMQIEKRMENKSTPVEKIEKNTGFLSEMAIKKC